MQFSHAIYDNAFPAKLCRQADAEWPSSDWPGWNAVYQAEYQKKRAANHWQQMPQACRELLRQMLFLNQGRLGFGDLIPDMSLWGGGMHSLESGGVLGLHLDASHHAQNCLPRVLNGILFLNREWKAEWGGDLEIWDRERTRPIVKIAPVFNRLVVFATNNTTWHGVPTPLSCPADVQRKTLAVWWYGSGKNEILRERAHFAAQEE